MSSCLFIVEIEYPTQSEKSTEKEKNNKFCRISPDIQLRTPVCSKL